MRAQEMGRGNAESVLKRIEETARERYLPIIGPQKARILEDVIRRVLPKRILEVGTLIGYSAIVMGKELESAAEIVTIEIDEDEAELARENIRKAGIKARVEVLTGDALELIPTLSGVFDFVFLDADKGEYIECLRLIENKLRSGSVVVADNAGTFSFSMRNYLDYVRNSGKYESRYISVRWDGLEVSEKL